MRRVVAIQIGVAAGLWALGALCVAAEVRQPGFWYGRLKRSGDRVIGRSGDLRPNTATKPTGPTTLDLTRSPEPAYQNNEASVEQQDAEIPAQSSANQPAVDTHTRMIVISIPDRRLALLEDGEIVKTYPIAVGAKHSPSPEGEYTIINHSVNPTYRHKDKKIDPGKDNPLGSRWMGLSLKGFGIHGTNEQNSIGKAASHGCFRMKKKDVEELYALVQVGDAVSVRGKRDDLTAQLFMTPTVTAKNETPLPATLSGKPETTIASAAQNAAATAGGGGQ